jgi:uncharacterized protein
MDVVISGASGLIGRALTRALRAEGHRVVHLVRREPGDDEIRWDPAAGTIDGPERLEGVSAAVHLAGAGIGDRRWTDAYKRTILESRTTSTTLLAETLAGLSPRPEVLVSASAIGVYGDRGDEGLDETSPLGDGFLPDVCRAWEAATAAAEGAGIRVAHIRTGIVLTRDGGALKKMLPLFRVGLGGRFGSGDQWMSWIALEDEIGAILHLLHSPDRGPVNLTAPEPVRNRDFAATLGRVLRRPSAVPVPRFGPALVLGRELADDLLFTGQRVHPAVLLAGGYSFRFPTLDGALRHVLGKP